MDQPLVVSNAPLSSWLRDGLRARYQLRTLDAATAAERAVARVLLTSGMVGADAGDMDALPALRLVANHGVGVDRIDLAHARARGIAVTNTPDVLTDDVADMALALVLATMRRVAVNDRLVRDGRWHEAAPVLGRRVTGARFGIVGLGRIGRAIARRLEPFAGTISFHNRRPLPDVPYAYYQSVAALAAVSDVLIVAAAGGADSAGLIDRAVLDALGPAGVLVNIGRGSSVDEPALVSALAERRIAGAGLDVFADEPNPPPDLLALDTVVLQPHHASSTVETRQAMAELVLANVHAFFAGEPLPTPVG